MGDFWMDSNVQRILIVMLIILWFIAVFIVVEKIREVRKEIRLSKLVKEKREVEKR